MASIARAQSLEGARQVESQAQAQQQLQNFLSYGAGYQAGSRRCSTDARASARYWRLGRAAGFVLVAAAIIATVVRSRSPEGGAVAERDALRAKRSARRRARPLPGDRHGGAGRRRLRRGVGQNRRRFFTYRPPTDRAAPATSGASR